MNSVTNNNPLLAGQQSENSASSSPQNDSQSMGKQDFLKLLTTQLSNQDPMNPMKGQEFAAQLAQFSSVEQLTNIQQTLQTQGQTNQLLSQSINSGVAADLLGKRVEANGSQIEWQGGDDVDLGFELNQPADAATLTVRDETGATIYEKDLGSLDKGDHDVSWDGTTTDGASAPSGNYTFEVSAQDAEGDAVSAKTHMTGTVDRVTFGEDGIQLHINGAKVPMGQVQSVEPT